MPSRQPSPTGVQSPLISESSSQVSEKHVPKDVACKVCFDLQLDHVKDSYTEIVDSSLSGCSACLIIKQAIEALLGPDLNHDTSIHFWIRNADKESQSGLQIYIQEGKLGEALEGELREGSVHIIELYSSPETATPWTAITWKKLRNVENDATSLACLDLARSWIDECDTTHLDCHVRPHRLPTRVINVGSDATEPRLHISRGEFARYIALSHVWGHYQPLKTEKSTLAERLNAIPFSGMPKTFQDAVFLTRFLGIEYLWIDSLCIIQDDIDDWESEATRMADVYSNAHVVISVNDAKDCREGFLGPRDERALKSIPIPYQHPVIDNSGIGYVYARKSPLDLGQTGGSRPLGDAFVVNEVVHTGERRHIIPLIDTRCWTFQERLLSPRTLHYAASEMAFECREYTRCECTRKPTSHRKDILFKCQKTGTSEDEPNMQFKWMTVVESFTERNLTFNEDRLPAIAGIAAALQPYAASDYFYGLWRQELGKNLLWSVHRSESRSRRHRNAYAPTWSWASVIAPVMYQSLYEDWTQEEGDWAIVVALEEKKAMTNPYGPGQGSITLHGQLGFGVITALGINAHLRLGTGKDSGGPKDVHFYPDIVEQPEVTVGEEVSLFVVQHRRSSRPFNFYTLVLKHTGNGDSRTYQRIGLTHCIYHEDMLSWDTYFNTAVDIKVV